MGKGFRPVEGEYVAATRVRFKKIGEAGLQTGGLIAKWQGTARGWNGCRHTFAVFLRLNFDAYQGQPFGLRLDNADCLPVCE
jgi:hypothetical protein